MRDIVGEIIILEKKYSEKNLQLITGKKDISSHYQDIPEEMLLLSEVIEDPLNYLTCWKLSIPSDKE